ncbi:kelch domain-containing protein [Anaeramoeba ignava]|uniref:Kelch domain-containing protein n=1 Tax=Anaeramoeba ignava TaxID=1746090 RepID=A0A9Q0LXF3_ANAIG|nr:kelch domain-containing protein [Anaeramoeba ignava]
MDKKSLDIDIWNWHKVEMDPTDQPDNSCKSGFVGISDSEILVMYGWSGYRCNSDIHILNIESRSWKRLETTGKVPCPRYGMTTLFNKGKIYVFGGYNLNSYLDDFFELDLKTYNWKSLPQEPKGRHSHVAFFHNDEMIIFGGRLNHDGVRTNDMWYYTLNEKKWREVKGFGEVPAERSSHVGVLFENQIYIFGGVDLNEDALNDLYSYSLDFCHWRKIILPSDFLIPPPCSSPTALLYKSRMIIVGGQYRLSSKREDFDETFEFDLIENKWKKKKIYFKIPRRSCHNATILNNSIIIFGGEFMEREHSFKHLNDVWKLDLVKDIQSELMNFLELDIFADI